MAASARIDELRSKFDDNPRRYFASLANEYRKAGDLSTAIAICRTQLRHFPSHMSGYVVLGQALYESGEMDAARIAFERAVELDPENLIALRHLGDVATTLSDDAAARRWYGRVLEIDPGNEAIAAQVARIGDPAPAAPLDPDGPRPADDRLYTADEIEIAPVVELSDGRDPPEMDAEHGASLPDAEAPTAVVVPEPELVDLTPEPAPESPDTEFVDDWTLPSMEETDGPDAAGLPLLDLDDVLDLAPDGSAVPASPEATALQETRDPTATRTDDVAPSSDVAVGLDLPPLDDRALDQLEHADAVGPLVDDALPDVEDHPVAPLGDDEPPAAAPELERHLPVGAPVRAERHDLSPDAGEPVPAEEDAVEVVPSEAFATETMAELCVRQGHDEQALAIYDQLVAHRPEDAALAERRAVVLARVSARGGAETQTAGAYLRRLAERRPTGATPAAGQPAVDAHVIEAPPAATPDVEVRESDRPSPAPVDERTAWAAEAWAGAFRADAAPSEPIFVAPARDLSFERFFVGLETLPDAPVATLEPDAETERAGMDDEGIASRAETGIDALPEPVETPSSTAVAPEASDDDDLEAFNTWLKGIRDS